MTRKKIMIVVGTRPEAIKMAPLILSFQKNPAVETVICLTAQHRQMLDQILRLFQINADIDLNLMRPAQTLAEISSSILLEMDRVLKETQPDWVLAQGDTSTVMATALAAYYNQIKFGHVEAGLRSYNKWAPFPEEINRKIAGIVADLHFCPTENAKENLIREGFLAENCHVTGNTVIDALRLATEMDFSMEDSPLACVPFGEKEIITVTAHRRENLGEPLEDICDAIAELGDKYAGRAHFVYPVHLNPAVRKTVCAKLGDHPAVTLLEPLDYLPMAMLLKRSKILLTDSGGLQEEAPGLGVPVLVLREVTERPEGLATGNARLVGSNREKIAAEVSRLLDDPAWWRRMAEAANPYGDGHAAERIVKLILDAKGQNN